MAAGRSRVDAVLYTHEHADHINGIDDLRMFSVTQPKPASRVYGPTETLERLRSTFQYIFDETMRPYEGTSKPALELYPIEPGRPVTVAGVDVLPARLSARSSPRVRLPDRRHGLHHRREGSAAEAMRPCLRGLKVLVLNALWWRPHPTHLSIDEAVRTAQELGAERTFLTHLTHETGHAELAASLPAGVAPAYDGLTVDID